MVEALHFPGRQKILLHTDGEPAIRALTDVAAKQWNKEAQIQIAPRNSHTSKGAMERAFLEVSRQLRIRIHAFEPRYPSYKIKPNGLVYPWVVRQATWLLTRFLVKQMAKCHMNVCEVEQTTEKSERSQMEKSHISSLPMTRKEN